MTRWIERAFCFSKKEFLVLLGLGGIGSIYSFELPAREEMGREEVISLLYGLVKRGFAEVGEGQDRPVLSRDISSFLEMLRSASWGLTVMPGKAGLQKIIYLGDKGCVLTELTGQKDEIRVRAVSDGELRELIMDSEALPPMPFETEEDGRRMFRYNLLCQEDQDRLKRKWEKPGEKTAHSIDEPLLSAMEREQAAWAWELGALGEQRNLKRALFVEGRVNPWILWQTREKAEVFFDSLERREMLVKDITEHI